jgi:hypothetical protein
MAQLQNDSRKYPSEEAFSIIYSGTTVDSIPIRMLLSDMWIWEARTNDTTGAELDNDIRGEAENDLYEAMNRLDQRLEKDSNCEPSWAEYTEGYLIHAKDYY